MAREKASATDLMLGDRYKDVVALLPDEEMISIFRLARVVQPRLLVDGWNGTTMSVTGRYMFICYDTYYGTRFHLC
jgi:hypothetical protein